MKLISQGAEAKLFLKQTAHHDSIIKDRFKKTYRHPVLDERLRKQRTKKEAKLLEDLYALSFVPTLIKKETYVLEMEYLDGKKIRDVLSADTAQQLCTEIGQKIRQLHARGIIHGDLTTSNLLWHNHAVYFIDFGLSFHSDKIEDKAVDLHVLKEAFESKHSELSEKCFAVVIKAYGDVNVQKRLSEVERRGRNKNKGS